jgi:hypothetical protein
MKKAVVIGIVAYLGLCAYAWKKSMDMMAKIFGDYKEQH